MASTTKGVSVFQKSHFFERISSESARKVKEIHAELIKNCTWESLQYPFYINGEKYYAYSPIRARGSYNLITKVIEGDDTNINLLLTEKLYLTALLRVDPYIAINGVDSDKKLIDRDKIEYLTQKAKKTH